MRNIFDQYDQPENRLTHALVCTLANERRLLRSFVQWMGAGKVPPVSRLHIVEQQVPGEVVSGEESESRGLPDACIYDDEGWVCLIEAKVQAGISVAQLRRHVATAKRYGFQDPYSRIDCCRSPCTQTSRAYARGPMARRIQVVSALRRPLNVGPHVL